MISINLDDVESYKVLSITACEATSNAKAKLEAAASSLSEIQFNYNDLSHDDPTYNYDAIVKERDNIVKEINAKAKSIEGFWQELTSIDELCDSFIEDVEADEEEIMGILGAYSDSEFGEKLADSNRTTNDITSFRAGDCDYYINKNGVILSMEPWSNDSADVITLQQDSYVKKLYTVDTNAGSYTAVLCEYKGKMVTGFVPTNSLSQTYNNFNNGESHSNIDDTFSSSDGYGIVTGGGLRLREYPTSESGQEYKVIKNVPDGTRVKIVGVLQNGEQNAETWYIVSYTTDDGYNFTGFANGEFVSTTNADHQEYKTLEQVKPVVMTTDAKVCVMGEVEFRPMTTGQQFDLISEIDDAYLVSWTENGEEKRAWIPKEYAEQVLPKSLSNFDDAQ